jgi:lipopolysaccharide biosynthesis glycosyltransferase
MFKSLKEIIKQQIEEKAIELAYKSEVQILSNNQAYLSSQIADLNDKHEEQLKFNQIVENKFLIV